MFQLTCLHTGIFHESVKSQSILTLTTSHKSIRKQLVLFVAEPKFPVLDLITFNCRIQRM